MKDNTFYNAHTHIFTLKHVPDEFARGYFSIFGKTIKISWLKKVGILRWLVKTIPKLRGSDYDMAERLINIVKHGGGETTEGRTQEQIFDNLKGYYPFGTKFIVLPMDMNYMNAGNIPESYQEQLNQLETIKDSSKYRDIIYPFIFADPRRFQEDGTYIKTLKEKLLSAKFSGIKMYPALGYWPFDGHLEEMYDFAVEHNIPIMTHCIRGVVHDRGKKRFEYHPIKTDAKLPGKKSKEYSIHFTHPINFHCLMDPDIISEFWGKRKDYSKLKVCLAHFGGAEEWRKYLKNPWIADQDDEAHQGDYPSLKIENWTFDLETGPHQYSWFSVIKEMIGKYKNVYADISFMLYDKEIWPLLKLMLNSDEKLRKRILFGTDYYVVAQKGTERELSIGIRSYLGEELFFQIARHNVEEYLSTDLAN